ncbi:MAG: hypothetical protein QOE70_2102 [Chthoniobacter sp.]|jgi:hypothetical protein|nr:hypothetical protein [Chthoniobacter sp.]
MKKQPPPAFPIEAIFPGIHAERPDIAAAEGEAFLEHGHKTPGFDLAGDPSVRVAMLNVPRDSFIDFEVRPIPSPLKERIVALPRNWQEDETTFAEVESLLCTAEQQLAIPAHCYATLTEQKQLWIRRKP